MISLRHLRALGRYALRGAMACGLIADAGAQQLRYLDRVDPTQLERPLNDFVKANACAMRPLPHEAAENLDDAFNRVVVGCRVMAPLFTGIRPNEYVQAFNQLVIAAAVRPIVADAYAGPGGADTSTCGALATPCASVDRARAQIAKLNNAGRSGNRVLAWLGSGNYYIPNTIVFTASDNPSPLTATYAPAQYTLTVQPGYRGQSLNLSAGKDISGTFTPLTLPGGGAGCVSSALTPFAPLTTANTAGTLLPGATSQAQRYVGRATVNGKGARLPVYPEVGSQWLQAPGTIGSPSTGSASNASTQTATFTSGSTSIGVSDLSQIGNVGETLAFNAGAAGFGTVARRYWILTKSAQTGSGTITLSTTPGGAAQSATANGTAIIMDPVQPLLWSDRLALSGWNQMTLANAGDISSQPTPSSTTNVTDIKIEVAVAGPVHNIIPLATKSGATITLAAHSHDFLGGTNTLWAGNAYRFQGDYGHMGSGAGGEVYTDRQTGLIYYSLRAGESCTGTSPGSLDLPGAFIIPQFDQIIRVSNSVADSTYNRATDGFAATTNVYAGNINFLNVTFSDTNTAVYTKSFADVQGNVGGVIGTGSTFGTASLLPAIGTIGAINLLFDSGKLGGTSHLGGNAFYVANGSSHITIQNEISRDIGGSWVSGGGIAQASNSYLYNARGGSGGLIGTGNFGTSLGAANDTWTNASNCCITLTNNDVDDVGEVNPGSGVFTGGGTQTYSITRNKWTHSKAFIIANNSGLQLTSPGDLGATNHQIGLFRQGVFGWDAEHNEFGYAGYEYTLSGVAVPGSSMMVDYGLVYTAAPQGGLGPSGPPSMLFKFNYLHDISSSFGQTINANGSVVPGNHGRNAVLHYTDLNSGNGIVFQYNQAFCADTVNGFTQYCNAMTQNTGGLQTQIRNNIYAVTFPNDSTAYLNQTVDESQYQWVATHAYSCGTGVSLCYILDAAGQVWSTSSVGTSGTVEPNGAGPTFTDGGVTWTFVQAIPNFQRVFTNNIQYWTVRGSTTPSALELWLATTQKTPVPLWQFFAFDRNMYFQAGATITTYTTQNGGVSWAAFKAAPFNQEAQGLINVDPNMVDALHGNLAFKTTGGSPNCINVQTGQPDGTYSPACAMSPPFQTWNLNDYGPQ